MPIKRLLVNTSGEGFYDVTQEIKSCINEELGSHSGLIYLFIMHTSCALTISESFDPSAKADMENFLIHIAPRNLNFITHDAEGPDDSPSHMKSILLNQNICLPVENGEILLGAWQGIYLSEFRDDTKRREILIKFLKG